MDRRAWLQDRRAAVEQDYTNDAPNYDAGYDPRTPVHRRFVASLVETVPPGGSVLDAACGTAPYAGAVLETGRSYVGIDQSIGMLDRAREKWPEGRFELVGLQELALTDGFDAVMCIDAMENVPPEDWPVVLAAFHRALTPGGHVYITIERIDADVIEEAYAVGTEAGLPMVRGEVIEGDTAGYHFYPDEAAVRGWLADAGFEIVDQVDEWLDGYGYRHFLLRS